MGYVVISNPFFHFSGQHSIMFFFLSCITMAPQVDSKISQSCDVIGLQKQVCAEHFEPLLQEIEKVGKNLRSMFSWLKED